MHLLKQYTRWNAEENVTSRQAIRDKPFTSPRHPAEATNVAFPSHDLLPLLDGSFPFRPAPFFLSSGLDISFFSIDIQHRPAVAFATLSSASLPDVHLWPF